jgi:hypothetical protein
MSKNLTKLFYFYGILKAAEEKTSIRICNPVLLVSNPSPGSVTECHNPEHWLL